MCGALFPSCQSLMGRVAHRKAEHISGKGRSKDQPSLWLELSCHSPQIWLILSYSHTHALTSSVWLNLSPISTTVTVPNPSDPGNAFGNIILTLVQVSQCLRPHSVILCYLAKLRRLGSLCRVISLVWVEIEVIHSCSGKHQVLVRPRATPA